MQINLYIPSHPFHRHGVERHGFDCNLMPSIYDMFVRVCTYIYIHIQNVFPWPGDDMEQSFMNTNRLVRTNLSEVSSQPSIDISGLSWTLFTYLHFVVYICTYVYT